MRTSWLTIDGLRIALHESDGSGPAAVFLHGHWSAAVAFQHQLAGPLGAEFRSVAVDLPGEGDSDKSPDPSIYSMPGFAAVLTKVARAADLENAVFVGWSLGGHILIEAMPQLPRARGFCVFGTPPLRFPPNFEEAFLPHPAMTLLFKEELSDEEYAAWADVLVRPGDAPPTALTRAMRRGDPKKRPALQESIGTVGYRDETAIVAGLRQPLAVIHGEHDVFVGLPYLQSLPMPSLWRGAIQVIPGAGHAAQWDSADAFNGLVAGFLRSA
jgi:pimeloyl-ACP methyl ester carboxylesterase